MRYLVHYLRKCTFEAVVLTTQPYVLLGIHINIAITFLLISLWKQQKKNVGLYIILVTICIIIFTEDGVYRPVLMVKCRADRGQVIIMSNGRSNTLEKDTFQSSPVLTSIRVLMRNSCELYGSQKERSLRLIQEKFQSCARLYGDKDSDWTNNTPGTIYKKNKRSSNSGSMRWKYQRIPFRIRELMVQ